MSGAVAAPPAPTPPSAPAPLDGDQTPGEDAPGTADELSSEPVDVVVLLKDQPTRLSTAQESARLQAQQELVDAWSQEHGLEVDRQFGYLVNGFSATVPGDRLAALSLEPEVASVRRERVYERTEHTARELQGVPAAFEDHGVDGTGMVISIIDSGIDPGHHALRLDDCSAAAITHVNEAAEAGFTCKVPDGYNYADENFVIKDSVVEAHGQHVGGIAAANGSAGDQPGDFLETGDLDGVAPNAQLLAMKVFSNAGGGATDSDIVAAIEDSVKLDADVINMSLGASNGHKNASDASSLAIEAARDAGVVSVIAAGNDEQNFSAGGVADDLYGLHDDGTVGSPGTLGSALTVASIDNAALTQLMAYVNDQSEGIPYSPATGTHDGAPHRLVDLGLATAEETAGMDLAGDYALIARGEISFTEKYENAIAADAGGVVLYNTADEPFGMAGVETFTLPGITLPRSAGLELVAAVAAGETTLRITDEVDVRPSPEGLRPSYFTSWGATPTLDFEPEIAGIGGSVYSTYNDDTYGSNSGTSMASPNVAGMTALVLQHLEQTRPEVTGAERVDLAKVMLMNTAMIPTEEGATTPSASPRQVGAGLAQVDRALTSRVIATVDGEGAAALREIDGSAPFTITLTSSAETDLEFTLPEVMLLAETNEAGAATTVRSSGGSVSTPDTVTVPAGGSVSVEVTVRPESGGDHFTGGWVQFLSSGATQPDLAVPFLGFAGDWNAEPIILPEGEQLEGVGVQSELITSWGGSTLPLTSDYGQFWLSPNGDGDMDVIAPNLVPMRNASDLRYTVLDSAGDELKVLGQEQGLYRSLLGDWTLHEDPRVLQWTGATFDGTIYDPQAVDHAALPDGRYTYRVETRLGPEQEWQSTDFDFGIDATPPEIEFGPYEAGLLSFEVVETGSGLLAPPTVTGAAGDEIPVTEAPDGSYAIQVDPESVPFVTVSVLDAGFNLGAGTKVFEQSTMLIADATQLEQEVLGPQSLLVSDDALQLTGYVSSDIVAVRVGEETVETPEGRFRHLVPLDEGPQEIVVQGLDGQGEVVQEQSLTVTYDATAPELTVTEMATDAEGAAVLDEDGTLAVRGTLTDERQGAELSITSGQTAGEVAADGSFEITVTPKQAAAAFTLTASDGVNTTSESFAISGRAQQSGWAMSEITNADCMVDSATCFVPGGTADVSPDGTIFTLRGEYPAGGSITLTPGSRAGEDGRYVDAEPISASIGEDGVFAVDLPVATGENHFRMVIQDQDGQVRYDRGIRLHVDVTAPTLQVQEPTLVGGTLYTDSEQVAVAGTASDDGWGYGLSLNDSIIIERFDLGSPGEESNTRDFSTEITVADGDTLLLEFSDSNGNVLLGLIPVVLDQDVPRLDIANLRDGETVGDDREIEVSASDENLAGLQVLLDGEVVHDEITDLATQEHTVEDALFDLRELESEESEDGQADAATEDGRADAEPTDQEATDSAADPTPEVTATGARTRAVQDTLTARVATTDLAEGSHTLTVVATDLAGGTTTRALDFQVAPSEAEVGISGPAEVELSIHREELGAQSTLAQAVLSQYELTLDGDADAATEAGLSSRLAPGTVLVEGEQQVTLLAVDDSGDLLVDAAGDPLELTIAVSLTLERVTLADGEVTATATFRSDDTLTVAIEAAEGEGRVLELTTAYGSLEAVITVPGAEGDTALRLLPDGSRVPVAASWSGGVLSVTGPSQGSYLILPAGAPGGEGGGPGAGGGGADAPGSGDTPGAGAEGESTSGDRGGPGGPLARTGTEALGPLAAAGALLLLGGLLRARRRH
ncbi:S8 family serine peptidase [Brachybacterium sp.]|uniref:S8 family serine peptidase n=1 Tax=Brachybacterium sp. TaxID=1891286 RepID=UPI002ED3F844